MQPRAPRPRNHIRVAGVDVADGTECRCCVCRKKFTIIVSERDWGYKVDDDADGRHQLCCSYTCMRKWETPRIRASLEAVRKDIERENRERKNWLDRMRSMQWAQSYDGIIRKIQEYARKEMAFNQRGEYIDAHKAHIKRATAVQILKEFMTREQKEFKRIATK